MATRSDDKDRWNGRELLGVLARVLSGALVLAATSCVGARPIPPAADAACDGCTSDAGNDAASDATTAADGGLDDAEAGAPSAACVEYCDTVMSACAGPYAVYASRDVCLSVCARLPEGTPGDMSGDTIACRVANARLAAETGEYSFHCGFAGPVGNGTCGDSCDAYCKLMLSTCPGEYTTYSQCRSACASMHDLGNYDITMQEGDTLQCRIYHVTSATQDPTVHCPHAGATPTENCVGDGGLSGEAGAENLCDNYCRFVMETCTDDLAVYTSVAACEAACPHFPQGTVADESGDSVHCRTFHTANSVAEAPTHCPHAGAGGDGHCGSHCEGYCDIMMDVCPGAFSTREDCMNACAQVPGAANDSGYSATISSGNSLQCRLTFAVAACTDPANCAAAEGMSPCQ